MVVAIHQPDLMPWAGFFSKIAKSNITVILDHTINNIKDQSWFRRTKVIYSSRPFWISIPIEKGEYGKFQPLNKMKILNTPQTCKLFLKYKHGFEQNYSKKKYYKKFSHLFFDYFNSTEEFLVKKNLCFIIQVLNYCNIKTELVLSSTLNLKNSSTPLLLEIMKKLGADTYLSGDGCENYFEEKTFFENGLKIVKNNFLTSEGQKLFAKNFNPSCSILDYLIEHDTNEIALPSRL